MIFGERIRFRAVEHDDLSTFVKWLNDPEVQRGIGVYQPYAMADEEQWYEEMRKKKPDEHNLAIEVRLPRERDMLSGERAGLPRERDMLSGERAGLPGEPAGEAAEAAWKLIGSCSFFDLHPRNRSAEFGIMIGDKSFWNQGYGTEAVRLLCRHGFQTLNLHRIYLRVLENNPRAIRAYEKAGFTHEGRQRQAEFREGKYIDMLVMSMLKEEYELNPPDPSLSAV